MFGYVKLSGGISLTMVLADLTTFAGIVLLSIQQAGIELDSKWLTAGLIASGALNRALRARTYEPMLYKFDSVVGEAESLSRKPPAGHGGEGA